jgi:hypothetical protein
MSTIVVLKEADTLFLGTDSRYMAHDFSGIASDAEQKIFPIAPDTFIAVSGRKVISEFQAARARELAVELGTSDIQAIGAALERESLPCLAALVERLREEPDEMTRQHVSGESLLHGCTLVGRTAGGQLGYVHQTYRVQADGTIGCAVEPYFEAPRKITATSGGSAHQLAALASRFAQNTATWTDPPERVAVRFLAEIKRSTPTVGGPDQMVCLDKNGSHWISRPPLAAVPLVGDLLTATITAAISIMSPTISGGSITGASVTSTLNGVTVEANGTYDSTLGLNTGLRVKSAATPNLRVVVVPSGVWMIDAAGVVRTQVFADGTITLHDSTGASRVIVDAGNGQILMDDAAGNTRVQMDTFGGAGHISVSGTGASITINGRSL